MFNSFLETKLKKKISFTIETDPPMLLKKKKK